MNLSVQLLIGILIGAGGLYLGQRLVDWARRNEAEKKNREEFEGVEEQIPKLIAEMREDLTDPKNKHLREFFVLRSSNTRLNTPGRDRILRYHREEHQDLDSQIEILKGRGYVTKISPPSKADRYRMSEEFVRLLRETTDS